MRAAMVWDWRLEEDGEVLDTSSARWSLTASISTPTCICRFRVHLQLPCPLLLLPAPCCWLHQPPMDNALIVFDQMGIKVGGVTGIALAATLFIGFGSLSLLFTDDPAVLDVARSGVWFITISQPVNAIAFVADGLYYGVSDFAFAAYSMFFATAISSVFLLIAAPKFGLGGIWAGLTLFMSLRAIAGFWRLGSKGGPWEIILSEGE